MNKRSHNGGFLGQQGNRGTIFLAASRVLLYERRPVRPQTAPAPPPTPSGSTTATRPSSSSTATRPPTFPTATSGATLSTNSSPTRRSTTAAPTTSSGPSPTGKAPSATWPPTTRPPTRPPSPTTKSTTPTATSTTRPTTPSTPSSATPRLWDDDTALQNNLNRWYDPATARWLPHAPASSSIRLLQHAPYTRRGALTAQGLGAKESLANAYAATLSPTDSATPHLIRCRIQRRFKPPWRRPPSK